MKTLTMILILMTICASTCFAQQNDTITKVRAFGGYRFYKGGKMLTMNQLAHAVRSNDQAFRAARSAQSNHTFASIIGGAGGFLVGWPVGTALGGGEPNWALAGVGAGLIVLSIPISQSAAKHAVNAVDVYNDGLRAVSTRQKSEWRLAATPHGVGLTLRF